MKKKKMSKALRTGLLAAAAVCCLAAAVLLYLRFLAVPEAPEASDAVLYVSAEGGACIMTQAGACVAVLPVGETAGEWDASFYGLLSRRFDVCILPSVSDASLLAARRFLAKASVKTLLVPRGIPDDELAVLERAVGNGSVVRMPSRKAVVAGEFQFYDTGRADAMSLLVSCGENRVLFAASASSGSFGTAVCSSSALESSSFSCDGPVFVAGAVPSGTKVRALSVKSLSGQETVYLEGNAGRR